MTGKERISRILRRLPVDRIGLNESFWVDTIKLWRAEGRIGPEEDIPSHFGLDIATCWTFNLIADLDYVPEVLEETDETILKRNGNGAVLRSHKLHDSTPEHVDYAVKVADDYVRLIRPLLTPSERRINFESYRRMKALCEREGRFFTWGGVGPFESMHPVCGHENLLVGMALEPEWVYEMSMDYSRLAVDMMKLLFEREGKPDGLYFFEDMGFKQRPFMSTQMYRDLVRPGQKLLFDYAKSIGLPIIMHSCGFIEPYIESLLEIGLDMLDVMEVKAGMDPLRIFNQYGDRLSLSGGIDVRVLNTGNLADIDRELESKIPVMMKNNGLILHSDHSIPASVPYETYLYFIKKGLELGTY